MSKRDASVGGNDAPRRLGFLLAPNFALMSWAAVCEPFRAANALSGRELYRWTLLSAGDERSVIASNGARIATDALVGDDPPLNVAFVCVGGEPAAFSDRAVFTWIRKLVRRGVIVAGVSGGAYTLARAGVLDGYRATIHWEHLPAFREAFAAVDAVQALYVVDRNRLTCAGGIAGLDLALEMIAADHGAKLSAEVAEWYIRTQEREGAQSQRLSLRDRFSVANRGVLQALALMEANVARPLSRQTLAAMLNISTRQLNRAFAEHLSVTPSQIYVRLRLEHAKRLIAGSSMSLTEVAMATGFASVSHFSRRFAQLFGAPPRALRRRAVCLKRRSSMR